MASGQHHLQNEATEPSETRQDRTQRFQNQLASLPANTEVVTSLSHFHNINNFIAIHPGCDDDVNSDPNYAFSDLPSQASGSYNSGPSDDIELNENQDIPQLEAVDEVRGCTGAELCTSGRYNQGPSSLPEGAEYCVPDEPKEQTALKTIALAVEHEEAQQVPAPNCAESFPLQSSSSGYITDANRPTGGISRDRLNRLLPIQETFLESLQTNRKSGSALAVVVAAENNRDDEEDEDDEEPGGEDDY